MPAEQKIHWESLEESANHILEEARTVVPGVQAIFGFQLIAVFNQRFEMILSPLQQRLHLLATGSTAVAMALIMAPTAYHRLAEPGRITKSFITTSTKLLTGAMAALTIGTCIDFSLIGTAVTKKMSFGVASSAILLSIFLGLWFALPIAIRRLKHPC